MSKIDATELIRQLEGRVVNLRSKLNEYQSLMDDTKDEIDKYECLLGLVKYEEEEEVIAIPEKPEYINEDGSVDWSKVPKGTLVEVSDNAENWFVRHFNSYTPNDKVSRYRAYVEGYDGNNNYNYVRWLWCRLYDGEISK